MVPPCRAFGIFRPFPLYLLTFVERKSFELSQFDCKSDSPAKEHGTPYFSFKPKSKIRKSLFYFLSPGLDSNQRPSPYEGATLTPELPAHFKERIGAGG